MLNAFAKGLNMFKEEKLQIQEVCNGKIHLIDAIPE